MNDPYKWVMKSRKQIDLGLIIKFKKNMEEKEPLRLCALFANHEWQQVGL